MGPLDAVFIGSAYLLEMISVGDCEVSLGESDRWSTNSRCQIDQGEVFDPEYEAMSELIPEVRCSESDNSRCSKGKYPDVGESAATMPLVSIEARSGVELGPIVCVELPLFEAGIDDKHEEMTYMLTSGEGLKTIVDEVI